MENEDKLDTVPAEVVAHQDSVAAMKKFITTADALDGPAGDEEKSRDRDEYDEVALDDSDEYEDYGYDVTVAQVTVKSLDEVNSLFKNIFN